MINLLQFIKAFGFFLGFYIYAKLKLKISNKYKLPSIKSTIFLDPKTIDEYTFKEIFVYKDYDLDEKYRLSRNPVIIDAGANIGLSAVFFANKYPNSHIICLEPEEKNFKSLIQNAAKYKNIKALQAALWVKTGSVSILNLGSGKRSFMIGEATHNLIPSHSILDIMSENKISIIDILKIDIEGSEKELFEQGYELWLPKVRCIIIELHDSMRKGSSRAFFHALSEYDFSVELKGENIVCYNESLSDIEN